MRGSVFIVVPFLAGARGHLHPGTPVSVPSESSARIIAQKVSVFCVGAAILEQPDCDFEEPRLVEATGRVPETIHALAA